MCFSIKGQTQMPQKYHGNPTYAILEIESRLKLKQTGIASTSTVNTNGDLEPIKGYTKQMMDVLRKQQILVEKQILTPQSKKPRAGMVKEISKPLKSKTVGRKRKLTKIMPVEKPTLTTSRRKSKKESEIVETEEIPIIEPVIDKICKAGRKTRNRGTKEKPKVDLKPQKIEIDEVENEIEEIEPKIKRKRGRPRIIKSIIETPETEEDSVYYDIPGEGSNYDTKELSEDENVSVSQKSLRNVIFTSGEESNQASIGASSKGKNKKGKGRSYYADDDYDVSSDEVSIISIVSSIADSSESKKNSRRKNIQGSVKSTRNKTKSRSASVSAPVVEESEPSECSELLETEYEAQSGDESDEIQLEYDQSETDEDEEEDSASESDVDDQSSNDSVDFKYSPITKTKSRRNEFRNIKTSKGKIFTIFLNIFINL